MKSHQTRGFFICLGVTLLVLVMYVFGGFDSLELKAVDFRFQFRGNRPVNPALAVVTIDEKSISELGMWPWPRATHAKLTRQLAAHGARVIAWDSLFTEKDATRPESDAELGKAAEETGRVVSSFFFKEGFDRKIYGKEPLFPIAGLAHHSYTGFVNSDPDRDGVTRRAPLYAINGEAVYPSLAVAAMALWENKTINDLLPTLPVIVNPDPDLAENELFINYAFDKASPTGYPYPIYSYADVLNGRVKPEEFKDKLIFVGATAAALFDLKAIPFVSKHPGVMVHLNVVDNLLAGNYIREVPSYLTALYIIMLGLLFGYLLPRFSPWVKTGVFAGLFTAGIGISLWFFSSQNLVVPMVPPIFVALGCYGGILFYRLVIEEREKRKIKGSFKQYLSPKIIEIVTRDPSALKLGGEEREVTMFFLDIAGFTTMSEALKPTQLVEVMNHCLTRFSNIILKHDGLINKYIGDCIMAFWNAPVDQPRHAAQACLAALDCIAALPELNREFQARNLPVIDCRVGINTGIVVVGNMGSIHQFDYTVMGDPVNLASRLEGANKVYHTRIMISDTTFEEAKNEIEARDLDLIRVQGKKEPRKVFEVLCKKGQMPEDMAQGREKYHQALRYYRARQFNEAIAMFQEVFDYMPNDPLTRKYLERARAFQINPPLPTWDGSFEMKSK